MIYAEQALLLAVRDRLRAQCSYSDDECNVEFDEEVPAVAGNRYILVLPGGVRAGEHHATSGGVTDVVYGVDVVVIARVRHVPRDRTRNAFFTQYGSIQAEIDKIIAQVDWSYAINDAASAKIEDDNGSTYQFVEPLKFESLERRPRLVSGDMFAGTGERAGLARTISFGGARRLTVRI